MCSTTASLQNLLPFREFLYVQLGRWSFDRTWTSVCRADLVNSAKIASNVKGAGVLNSCAHPANRRQQVDAQNVGACVMNVRPAAGLTLTSQVGV